MIVKYLTALFALIFSIPLYAQCGAPLPKSFVEAKILACQTVELPEDYYYLDKDTSKTKLVTITVIAGFDTPNQSFDLNDLEETRFKNQTFDALFTQKSGFSCHKGMNIKSRDSTINLFLTQACCDAGEGGNPACAYNHIWADDISLMSYPGTEKRILKEKFQLTTYDF